MESGKLVDLVQAAISARLSLIDPRHEGALRLFNGFTEGYPELCIDLYATAALIHNYADPPTGAYTYMTQITELVCQLLPWIQAVLIKERCSEDQQRRKGIITRGAELPSQIVENGINYALELTLNRDASFYLDTRLLRKWAHDSLKGKTVLNAFAYTGSIGIAALAGGAKHVTQLDRTKAFLQISERSLALNQLPAGAQDCRAEDFFRYAGRLRRGEQQFDCIIIDPPFFSDSSAGRVDQQNEAMRIINKIRPLLAPSGILIAVNNAIFLSGVEYVRALESVCADGYLRMVGTIPVPEDFTGLRRLSPSQALPDPAPFNHSTKIAILQAA